MNQLLDKRCCNSTISVEKTSTQVLTDDDGMAWRVEVRATQVGGSMFPGDRAKKRNVGLGFT